VTETEQIVWNGAEALRPFLVPIGSLEPFPGNPRQGDVAALRSSLRRFGQVLPALVDPALGESGKPRIVARHHLALAATEEGWTHIAAIPNTFADEEEARAYLLADNRIPELGGYNLEALVTHLSALAELDALEGTGYTRDDVDTQLAELRRLRDETPRPPREPGGNGNDAELKEVVLLFSESHHKQVEQWLGIVAKEKRTDGPSETVYAALKIAAKTVNQS
jgi:hypothetical protein